MIEEVTLGYFNDIYSLLCVLENKKIDKCYFDKTFKFQLQNKDYFSFVYIKDNKVVGYISLLIKHALHHDHMTGEILELVVDPEYRNLKIGKQLIDYIEEFAVKLNLEELELCTSTYRKDAHRFYERYGFVMDHYNYIRRINQ